MVSSEGSKSRGDNSTFTHVIISRIQFLLGCWTEGLSPSLVVGQRPPLLLCYVDASKHQFTMY